MIEESSHSNTFPGKFYDEWKSYKHNIPDLYYKHVNNTELKADDKVTMTHLELHLLMLSAYEEGYSDCHENMVDRISG